MVYERVFIKLVAGAPSGGEARSAHDRAEGGEVGGAIDAHQSQLDFCSVNSSYEHHYCYL